MKKTKNSYIFFLFGFFPKSQKEKKISEMTQIWQEKEKREFFLEISLFQMSKFIFSFLVF
jgi:hypothetical protein